MSPEVENLKIKMITLTRNGGAYFDCICDKAVSTQVRDELEKATAKILPQSFFDVHFKITKIVADGELVAKGTHDELLAASPVYREIYDSQFKKEDAE